MKALPRINSAYWLTLCAASVFGTNTGDLVSDVFGIGHLAGLPWLAAAMALVLLTERFGPWATPVFFWLTIIIVRTAATNVGDAFRDFGLGFDVSLPLCLALFAGAVALYARVRDARPGAERNVDVSPLYWLCMILAGIAGTVGGDFLSFGVGLSPAGTAAGAGLFVAAGLLLGRRGLWFQPVYYWGLLALIRTAGTGAGDALAQSPLGLPVATLLSGLVFCGLVLGFYALRRDNRAIQPLSPGQISLGQLD